MIKPLSSFNFSIKKNDFVRQAATLFGGSAVGQLLLLLFTPMLARIYSSEAFGIFTVYSSVMMISTIVSTLRYEYAIALPENEDDAFGLLIINFYLPLCISVVLGIIVLIFKGYINHLFNLPLGSKAFYFLPIAVFVNGGIQGMNYYLLRQQRYNKISVAGLLRNLTTICVQAASVAISSGLGLIFGSVVAQFFISGFYLNTIFNGKRKVNIKPSYQKIKELAIRYKKIPIYTFTADLTGNLSAQLPTMIIGSIFGLEAAAFYGMSSRLVMSSFFLIGQSVGQVFYSKSASNLREKKQHYALVKRTVKNLFLIGAPPLVAVAIFAHPIFNIILGQKWDMAASIAQVMVPWWLASFVAMPVVDLFSVLGEQRFHLYFMAAQLAVRATCLYVGAYLLHSMVNTMAIFSGISCILSTFMVIVLLKKAKEFDAKP